MRCSLLRVALLLGLAALFAACSSKDVGTEEPPDELTAVPFASTKMLSAADLADLTSDPEGTLTFASTPSVLMDAHVGTILVAPISPATPVGLLRVVTKVIDREGGRLVLRTASAPIQLAFQKLHARIRRTIDDATIGEMTTQMIAAGLTRSSVRGLGGDVGAQIPLDFPIYDADGDPGTKTDQVSVHGSIGGGFRYDLTIDVDWGAIFDLPQAVTDCIASLANIFEGELPSCSIGDLLPEVKVAFEVDPRLEATLQMIGSASLSFEKELELATIVLPPIPLGPLVFLPSVDIVAKVEGSASAGFVIGAHGLAEFRTSFSASTKSGPELVPFELLRTDLSADDTQVTLAAEAKIGLGARLNLQLYGIVGPNAVARTYARVAGDVARDPCWEVHIGVEGEIGARVTSPALPVLGSLTLFEWTSPPFVAVDEKVADGSCLPVPRGPQLPPGHGPDADALAHPDFAQWSASIEDTTNDGRVRTPSGDGYDWTEMTLAIDGRYVIAGSRTDRLVKIDDDGRTIWTKRYRRESTTPPFILSRVAPSADAAMLVLTQSGDGEAPGVMKIGQAGLPLFRKTIAFDVLPACMLFAPMQLVRDGSGGYFLAGTCGGGASIAAIHLDAGGSVIAAHLIRDMAGDRSVLPTAIAAVDGELIIAGSTASTTDGTMMFALRFGDETSERPVPRFVKRYQSCEAPRSIVPLAVFAQADGQLLVSGSAGSSRTGFLARLRADGEVAFAGFQTRNQSDYFFLTAFAELPTTGFIATASTLDVDTFVPGLAVVGLDGGGRPLWAQRYLRPDGRAMSFGSLRLTNDGGVVVASLVERPLPTDQGGFATMKIFAKDGAAEGVTAEGLTVVDLPCELSTMPWSITIESSPARSTAANTVVE